MVICLERGADLRTAQLMPLPLTLSCFSKIQIGFSFLVPAQPGSPGQRAAERECVCVPIYALSMGSLQAYIAMQATGRVQCSVGWFCRSLGRRACVIYPTMDRSVSARRQPDPRYIGNETPGARSHVGHVTTWATVRGGRSVRRRFTYIGCMTVT